MQTTSIWDRLATIPLYRGPIGGAETPAPAVSEGGQPAPAAPAAAPAMPVQKAPAGGFRAPAGPNPLLSDAPPAATAPAAQPPAATPDPAAAQPPAQPAAAAPVPPPVAAPPAAPPAAPAPAAPPAQPEVLDFGGRRVALPSDDPTMAAALRAIHGDWQRQQATLTRLQQGRQPAAPQPPAAPAQAQPQAAPPAPAQSMAQTVAAAVQQALAGVNAEEIQNALWEDPGRALAPLLTQALTPVVQHFEQQLAQIQQAPATDPWVEEQKTAQAYEQELVGMYQDAENYPDLDRVLPLMQQLWQTQPYLLNLPNPMSTIYRFARGFMPAQPPLTVDTILANQALVQQLMEHPQVRDPIIRSHVERLRTGAPPPVITGQPGGMPPAAPPNRPRSIGEAGQAVRRFLGIT